MTATATTQAKVKFQVGARLIDAPLQGADLQTNVKQLMTNFPIFRMTTVLESDATVMPNGEIHYVVVMPPAKTNG